MAENRRGKENRFYFSRGQLVLLGAAFTFASLVIFILGVFVGKGIEARKLQHKEEPLVRIPVKPSAPQSGTAPAAPGKDEITFNESVPKRTAAAGAAEDSTRTVKPAEKVVKAAETKQDTAPKIDAAALKTPEKKPEASAPAENTAKKIERVETAEQKEEGKVWRAQVNAFPDERSARQIVDRLKNKGYNAYVTEVQNRGKSWFRVSVGKYNSREEADKVVEALRTKENFPKAFAASR
jgi:cell division septation protein DedD